MTVLYRLAPPASDSFGSCRLQETRTSLSDGPQYCIRQGPKLVVRRGPSLQGGSEVGFPILNMSELEHSGPDFDDARGRFSLSVSRAGTRVRRTSTGPTRSARLPRPRRRALRSLRAESPAPSTSLTPQTALGSIAPLPCVSVARSESYLAWNEPWSGESVAALTAATAFDGRHCSAKPSWARPPWLASCRRRASVVGLANVKDHLEVPRYEAASDCLKLADMVDAGEAAQKLLALGAADPELVALLGVHHS
jgi:hypothetical protein